MILPKFKYNTFVCIFLFGALVYAGDFHKHKQGITTDAERLKSLNDTFEELVKEKLATKDQDRITKILEELVAIEIEEKDIRKRLFKERNHLRFQHPEKDEDVSQLFRVFKTLSFRDRESKSGIDGKLSQLVLLVKKVYNLKIQIKEKEIFDNSDIKKKQTRFKRIEVVE